MDYALTIEECMQNYEQDIQNPDLYQTAALAEEVELEESYAEYEYQRAVLNRIKNTFAATVGSYFEEVI